MRQTPPTTGYLWRAHKGSPGQHGAVYLITRSMTQPERIEPVRCGDHLIHDWSVYDDWHLLGEVTLPVVDYVEFDGSRHVGVEMRGEIVDARELADAHCYRHT